MIRLAIIVVFLAIFFFVLWLEISDWRARRRAEQSYYGDRAARRDP